MKKTLPMLPLRGKYIFPNTVIHFDVSRSRSVKAIEEAMEHDQMIFLNNQIDPTAEDPGIEDLYRVGTLARIKQVVKLPKNILRVFAEGLFRAELSETVEYEPFYKVEVLYDHVEQQSFEEFEREAFLRMIKEAFEGYAKAWPHLDQNIVNYILLFLSIVLVNNVITSQFLGICPFLGVSKKVDTAVGMGVAVTFVLALASVITFFIQKILVATNTEYLQTIAFILVIASIVQFVEMVIKKMSPSLYQALGVYLPLITTNCAVLGIALVNVQNNYNLIATLINGAGAGIGFTLAIVLFAGIRERLELADIPEAFQGFPITLIAASLMSIAFLGFTGLIKL